MRLVIISHTTHKLSEEGIPFGWGPTVREIDALSHVCTSIYHLAFLHPGELNPSLLPYSSSNANFVRLYAAGGSRLIDKLRILFYLPRNLKIISNHIRNADAVQIRVPTGIGVYLLPWFYLAKRSYVLWVKYAGNWMQHSPPLSYRFQRFFLNQNFLRCKVTINGRWPTQPAHCLSFENPCLTSEELEFGKKCASLKSFDGKLSILFVGRLEDAKGVGRILELSKGVDPQSIKEIIFVGSGDVERYRKISTGISIPCTFVGSKSRMELNSYYEKCHIFMLPSSASEGFPKVVAEAAAFGCVPFVSDVSSLTQYVNESNGHVFSSLAVPQMTVEFNSLIQQRGDLKRRSDAVLAISEKFTYDYYNSRIVEEIINT